MENTENIEKCLEEASAKVLGFLAEQGGYSNGYYTYATGIISIEGDGFVRWETPVAKEELTQKGKEVRGRELYNDLQEILKNHQVKQILIRHKDEGYGAMSVEIVYIHETKKMLPLWSIK